MKTKSLLLAICLLPMAGFAQMDFSKQSQEKLAVLDLMVGTWEGTGYMMTPSGKETSNVKESIQYKLDNTILYIEGRGTKTMEDGSSEIVHDAVGIISYNSFTKAYEMNSFISKGLSTKANVEIKDGNNIIWWYKAGPATIRYSMNFENDTWTEKGERSMDGENWQQFFEMQLKKIS